MQDVECNITYYGLDGGHCSSPCSDQWASLVKNDGKRKCVNVVHNVTKRGLDDKTVPRDQAVVRGRKSGRRLVTCHTSVDSLVQKIAE